MYKIKIDAMFRKKLTEVKGGFEILCVKKIGDGCMLNDFLLFEREKMDVLSFWMQSSVRRSFAITTQCNGVVLFLTLQMQGVRQ